MMTKHLTKEFIQKIRDKVLAGKPKYKIAEELGISKTAVYTHTIDIPSNKRGKPLSKKIINQIREEILQGKSKHQTAKEMSLCPDTVYKHTKDLPNKYKRQPYISGKPLELLKELLEKGFVYTRENRNALRSLQKHFSVIKRAQFKNRSIYYLEDKNKLALQEMMKENRSRIINYQELGRVCQVFNTDLEIQQKRRFLGKKQKPKHNKIKKFRQHCQSCSKEKQTKIDDFFGRFLHSDVLEGFCVTW